MNKPASELIALDKAGLDAAVRECARITAPEISDEEYEKIVAEDSLRYRNTRLDMERTILAYLSAANQSSERAGVDALRSACERLQRFLDTFGDLGDCVTQADINDWLEQTATVYPWPKALCVYRHESNYWHGDISFARAPTDAEINALGAFLRDHHENTRPLATPPAQPAPVNESHAAASLDLSGGHNTVDAGGFDLSAPLSNVTIAIRPSETPSTHGKPADDVETCIACNTAFVEGDLIYPDQSGGCIHVSCCGPEMESYVNADGEPLKEGDPLPTPQRWTSAAAETSPGDVLAIRAAGNVRALIADLQGEHEVMCGPFDASKWKIEVPVADLQILVAAIDRLDVTAQAKSQEPEAVAIKPLCWRDHRPDSFPEPAWSAQTPFGFYNIEEVSASDSPAYVARLHAHHFIADKDSLDAAKAAAQADFEQRIRSALIHPTTKPEAPAVSVDAISLNGVTQVVYDHGPSFSWDECKKIAGSLLARFHITDRDARS